MSDAMDSRWLAVALLVTATAVCVLGVQSMTRDRWTGAKHAAYAAEVETRLLALEARVEGAP